MIYGIYGRLLCVIILFFSFPFLYRQIGKGFRVEKLYQALEKGPLVRAGITVDEMKSLLEQDFIYLGQGTQCYVFEGKDQKTVLKLFRFEQTQNSLYQFIRTRLRHKLPREGYALQKEKLLSACTVAGNLASEETALIGLHLVREGDLDCTFQLPLLCKQKINLGHYCFALQKKAAPFSCLYNEPARLSCRLESLKELVKKRAFKGIANRDSELERNFGFIGDQAVEIDFGSYALVNEEEAGLDAARFANRIETWVKKHCLH